MIPVESSSSIRRRERVEQLCQRFEREWSTSASPALESVLDQADSRDRSELLIELIAIEIELRLRSGESPRLEEFTKRFASHSSRISAKFDEVSAEFVGKWRRSGTTLIPEDLGDFRIVREIGRGSMGIVYEAEQRSLKRQVALKVLPAMFGLSISRLYRFRRESQAIARLHHSNIVEIYGSGEQDGLHYFAMQYVDGQALSHILDESPAPAAFIPNERVPPKRIRLVVRIGKQIAEALAYAHERGVLHRDVKPSNIILDQRENAWLTDFGLAKLSHHDEDSLSRDGDVIGTLRYLAPESLTGTSDERTDVYSLGLTLYELVTRRPAFSPKELSDSLHSLAKREPEPIEKRVSGLPRDFVTIIHKAIDARAEARYQTAGEMAEDLRRFLAGEPVLARRLSTVERISRWISANRTLAASFAISTVLLATTTIISLIAAIHLAASKIELKDLSTARKVAFQQSMKLAQENAEQRDVAQLAFEKSKLTVTDMMMSETQYAMDQGHFPQALLWTASAIENSAADSDRLQSNLIRYTTLRNRISEPIQLIDVPQSIGIDRVEFHPTGSHVLVKPLEYDRPWFLYKVVPGSPGTERPSVARCYEWSKLGDLLAEVEGKTTVVRSFPAMQKLASFQSHSDTNLVAFNTDARLLALAHEKSVLVWNRISGELVGAEYPQAARPVHLQFSPDGNWLVVSTSDNRFQMYRVGQQSFEPWVSDSQITVGNESVRGAPCFTDDSLGLITCNTSGNLGIWNPLSGKKIQNPTVAFQANGQITKRKGSNSFAIGSNSGLRILSLVKVHLPTSSSGLDVPLPVESSEHLLSTFHSTRRVKSLTKNETLSSQFHPITNRIVVTDNSPFATLYDYHYLSNEGVIATLGPAIRSVDYSANGSRLATASNSNQICIWSVPSDRKWELKRPANEPFGPTISRFSRDSKWIALSRSPGAGGVRVFDTSTASDVITFAEEVTVHDLAFSQDAQLLIGAAKDSERKGKVVFWDWQNRVKDKVIVKATLYLDFVPRISDALNLSTDGTRLAVFGEKDELVVFDLTDSQALASFNPSMSIESPSVGSTQMSPLGDSVFRIHDSLQSGRLFQIDSNSWSKKLEHSQKILNVAFARDGSRVATCSSDNTVCIWNPDTSRLVCAPLRHPSWVYGAEFSDDGQSILTICKDRSIRVWDVASGEQIGTEIRGTSDSEARFRPGSDEILVIDMEGNFTVWNYRLSRQNAPVRRLHLDRTLTPNRTHGMTISADGRFVAIHDHFTSHLIRLETPPLPESVSNDDLMLEAEVLSHHRFTETGRVTLMSSDEWRSKWERWIQTELKKNSVTKRERREQFNLQLSH